MAANMYRVGDYVYFETSSSTPYQIRRIEELNKTPNGNVEAKVMCFYRRRDISSSLILLADKHQSTLEEENEARQSEQITEKQRHQLKHRELFLSRQVETLPATHIRGKCSVTLLNETESLLSYLNKEDTFFYSLVYDPQQKTLLADKGEIRVGQRYQAEVTAKLKEGASDGRKLSDLETLVWSPSTRSSRLSDRQIDQFMVVARSVGTFARALDCTSTVRQPSLHMSAAAASRDITLYHAMDTLHKHKYDMSRAIASLVPPGGPVLCRDEMEEWSASEANLFEEALDKYGKDFNDVRQDFLPWKSLKSIVEYYYMWKTTDRYVQQKRIKAAEAETKLKQVYIPNYNKPNPAQLLPNGPEANTTRSCESCYETQSSQWFAWGPVHMQCRLCSTCWSYWKKNGGLKMPTRLGGSPSSGAVAGPMEAEPGRPGPEQRTERLAHLAAMRMHRCTISGCGKEFKLKSHLARHLAAAHGLAIRAGSPRPVMKTRAAFCLITTPLTRISRQICSDIMKVRHAARQPFIPINIAAIKQECQIRLQTLSESSVKKLTPQERHNLEVVVTKMGVDTKKELSAMLKHTPGARQPPAKYFYPKPPLHAMVACDRKPDQVNNQTNNVNNHNSVSNLSQPITQNGDGKTPNAVNHPSIMKKRGYEQSNGIDAGPPNKRQMGVIRQIGQLKNVNVRDSVINHLNGKGGRLVVSHRGRKQLLNWIDAPDDVYFYANEATRKLRKPLMPSDFRKLARKPWRANPNVKLPMPPTTPPLTNNARSTTPNSNHSTDVPLSIPPSANNGGAPPPGINPTKTASSVLVLD